MPIGYRADWGAGFPPDGQRYLSLQDMQTRLAPLGLTPAAGPIGNGPARVFRISGGAGTVSFISPLREHFCATCNRLRLTASARAC
jgi:cyclic pyranopterin phosphate synthase